MLYGCMILDFECILRPAESSTAVLSGICVSGCVAPPNLLLFRNNIVRMKNVHQRLRTFAFLYPLSHPRTRLLLAFLSWWLLEPNKR